MKKTYHARRSGSSAFFGLVALLVLIAGFGAALITSRLSQDPRSDASGGNLTKVDDYEEVTVWPTGSLIPLGEGQGHFPLNSQTIGMNGYGPRGERFQALTRPQSPFVFAVLPVENQATTWGPNTTVHVYGWTTAPCNTNNLSFEFYKVVQTGGIWSLSSTESINMGTLSQFPTNTGNETFCVTDPAKPGWNAVRIVGQVDATVGTTILASSLRLSYVHSGDDTTHIARVVLNEAALQNWPPTGGRMCGDWCSDQKATYCQTGYKCDYSKTKSRTFGICVIPSCVNQSCYCE